jgi:hypothetical protein
VVSASAWYGSRLCRKRLLKWKIPQAMEFQVVIEDHRVLGLVARAAGRSSACFRKLSALSWRGSGCSFADTATAEHANQPQPVLIGRIRGKMDGDHSLRCFGGWSEPQLTSPSCQVPACLQQRPEISGDGVPVSSSIQGHWSSEAAACCASKLACAVQVRLERPGSDASVFGNMRLPPGQRSDPPCARFILCRCITNDEALQWGASRASGRGYFVPVTSN